MQKNRGYHIAFLWLVSCTCTSRLGNEHGHAFHRRLLLFPFEYGRLNSGQHEGTSAKVQFPDVPNNVLLVWNSMAKLQLQKGPNV